MASRPELIWCADGNFQHSTEAVAAGWSYGVRLPARGMLKDTPLAFADQNWKQPNRAQYMALLSRYRPRLATVLDWEWEEQLPEVLSWAEEAAQYTSEAVLVVPKIPGTVRAIPGRIAGVEVRLAYSVPTSHGGSPLFLSEFFGRTVHLLGGSPQKQYELWTYLRANCEVRSLDGNMAKKMATSRCCYWQREKGPKGHWLALDGFTGDGHTECVRRSCLAVMQAWKSWAP